MEISRSVDKPFPYNIVNYSVIHKRDSPVILNYYFFFNPHLSGSTTLFFSEKVKKLLARKKNISIKVNSEWKRFTAFRATKSSVKRKEKRNHGCFSNTDPLKSFVEQTMDKNEGDLS